MTVEPMMMVRAIVFILFRAVVGTDKKEVYDDCDYVEHNREIQDILINKNVGDEITIKGKIKSIGEILGYSVDINEVF